MLLCEPYGLQAERLVQHIVDTYHRQDNHSFEEEGMVETGRRAAELYSTVLTPFSVAAIESIIFSWFSPAGVGPVTSPGLSALLGILILSIGPFVPVAYSVKIGRTDLDISDRNKRTPIFVISVIAYALGVMVFWAAGNKIMFVLSVAYLCVGFALMLITLAWKISAHAAATAGMATALWLVFGLWMLPVYVFVILTIWARVRLGAHTILQALAGAILSIVITALVFLGLYV
jgi:membrane-associated phospholipid phosphatase